MSALRCPNKQPRTMNQSQVTRTESVGTLETFVDKAEGKDHPSTTPQPEQKKTMTREKHPKGYDVYNLDEDVWKKMDAKEFLRLSSLAAINDVWIQPVSVEFDKTYYPKVKFVEITDSPYIEHREAEAKLAVDELLRMLYLNDCIQADIEGMMRIEYDVWFNEKSAACTKAKGVDDAHDRVKLCQFILTEDPTFMFYPKSLHGTTGVFFRKTTYHEFTDGKNTIINPSMIVSPTKGKFGYEYILEARLFPLPDEWFKEMGAIEEVPESQDPMA